MATPFVGRADELGLIRALIAQGRRERVPVSVLVTGESGAGKTRLLREATAQPERSTTIHVAGFEPNESIPLAAVGDLVRRLASVPEHGPRLEALVFGSEERRGQVLPVFEAAHRAVAASGPIVLAMDDLQWVDAQSMALVHYLIRAAETSRLPLTVVAASRPSGAALTFARGVDAALPEARRVALDITGLPLESGVELARSIDNDLDPAAAGELWKRAEGSPFWLESLARSRGATSVVDLISDRLRTLSPDAARLMSALAVVARPATNDEVAALLGWGDARLSHAVRELIALGLASEVPGRTRLAHDLIREAAFAVVAAATARRLQMRMAEIVEQSAGDDIALLAEALDRRAAAGLPSTALALRLATSPGRRLIGLDLLRRLSNIADGTAVGTEGQVELDAAIARVAGDLGEADLAIRHWSRVSAGTVDPGLQLRAELEAARAALHGRLDLSEVADRSSRSAAVASHLARARTLAVDPVSVIELDTLEAENQLWVQHDTAAGARAAGRAVEAGRELAARAGGIERLAPATRSVLLAALGPAIDAALQEERVDDVIELSDRALQIAGGLGDEARLVALIRTAFPYRSLGFAREAVARYEEAWDLSHRLILPMSMIEAGLGLARALHPLGRLREARQVARETAEIEARILPFRRWDTSQAMLDFLDLVRGEPGAMERLRVEAGRADPHFGIAVHSLVAQWLARRDGLRGRIDVERELDAASAASAIARCPRCERELQVVSAELLARIGRVAEARDSLDRWEAGNHGSTYPARRLWEARARALIQVAENDSAATSSLQDLAMAFDEAGKIEDSIWTHVDLGRRHQSRGERAAAIAAFSRAASAAESAGMLGLGRLASRSLRELGVRAWRRAPSAAGPQPVSLTEREQEVANLVAAGRSNSEIASSLVISPKTVERHLTNILAKLGARNRTELAGLVHARSGTGFPR
jgi:DNA-binding CsgD family transcriptional regulator